MANQSACSLAEMLMEHQRVMVEFRGSFIHSDTKIFGLQVT